MTNIKNEVDIITINSVNYKGKKIIQKCHGNKADSLKDKNYQNSLK